MRKLFVALIAVLFLAFGAVVGYSLYLLDSVGSGLAKANKGEGELFHFAAIMPASDRDPFFLRAQNGMAESAAKDGAVVQILEYERFYGTDSILRLLNLASELELDGLILSIPEDAAFLSQISRIVSGGTPVVTLETDIPASKRQAFIGSNEYELGVQAGLLASAGRRAVKAAIVLSSRYSDAPKRKNSLLMGFQSSANKSGRVELALVSSARPDALSGEEALREIIENRPDIGLIIFTGARDSAEAAQALIEFNRVGQVSIIGFDDTPEVLKFIETGVIQATLARNPEKAGGECVSALVALRKGLRTSAYVDTGLRLVEKSSLTRRVVEK